MLSKLSSILEVSPDAIAWLNNKFKDVGSHHRTSEKLYISRSDAKIRFVSNEPQLADVLNDFGFKTIVMSGLSIPDQISLFRNAAYIIGPHGAAFANLVFAKRGATFIEFFSKGHYAPCFNRISGIRGLSMDSWWVIRPGWADLISILTICGRFLLKPCERLDRDKLTISARYGGDGVATSAA